MIAIIFRNLLQKTLAVIQFVVITRHSFSSCTIRRLHMSWYVIISVFFPNFRKTCLPETRVLKKASDFAMTSVFSEFIYIFVSLCLTLLTNDRWQFYRDIEKKRRDEITSVFIFSFDKPPIAWFGFRWIRHLVDKLVFNSSWVWYAR